MDEEIKTIDEGTANSVSADQDAGRLSARSDL